MRDVPIRMKPESQRGRKRLTQEPTTQHCNRVQKETKWEKVFFFFPPHLSPCKLKATPISSSEFQLKASHLKLKISVPHQHAHWGCKHNRQQVPNKRADKLTFSLKSNGTMLSKWIQCNNNLQTYIHTWYAKTHAQIRCIYAKKKRHTCSQP